MGPMTRTTEELAQLVTEAIADVEALREAGRLARPKHPKNAASPDPAMAADLAVAYLTGAKEALESVETRPGG